jgi:hypothetical protein
MFDFKILFVIIFIILSDATESSFFADTCTHRVSIFLYGKELSPKFLMK